jgi:hypothetical protein
MPPFFKPQRVVVVDVEPPYAYVCDTHHDALGLSIFCRYTFAASIMYGDGSRPSVPTLQKQSRRHTMADVLRIDGQAQNPTPEERGQ